MSNEIYRHGMINHVDFALLGLQFVTKNVIILCCVLDLHAIRSLLDGFT